MYLYTIQQIYHEIWSKQNKTKNPHCHARHTPQLPGGEDSDSKSHKHSHHLQLWSNSAFFIHGPAVHASMPHLLATCHTWWHHHPGANSQWEPAGGESVTGHCNNAGQSAQVKRPVTIVISLGSNTCMSVADAPRVGYRHLGPMHHCCTVGGRICTKGHRAVISWGELTHTPTHTL